MATVLCNSGRAIVTNRIIGSGVSPSFVGWGVSSGTSSVTDTALFGEDTTSGYVRQNGTVSRVTTAVSNDTIQIVATQVALANLTITNAGNFDAISGGNIFVHGDFNGLSLNTNDSIQFTIKCQFN